MGPLSVRVDRSPGAAQLAQLAAALCGQVGRPAFQAGALLGAKGRALAVAGGSGAGKSTLLAASGAQLLCDELVVCEGGAAFAGPAVIDLRAGAAERLHAAPTPSPVASAPLAGWVFLEWGEEHALQELRPAERVAALTAAHVGTAPAGAELLELARLPAWRLTRPRAWSALEPSVAAVLELLDRS